ncbi:putative uncharacterized protein SLC66A1L [Camelus ferus]|uniref:Uncharacterized protein n=1 Tax=Camelus ferus TaxID=419612 RepID=A0A8B6YK36_CAMFR|nr:putative uncharacterized protein SLC66A1L [Camelus ferus]
MASLSSMLQVFICQLSSEFYVVYRHGKVEKALSMSLLLCQVGGDLTNFIGCYLTNQLHIQIFTAPFYMNMDRIMPLQFAYCKLKNQKKTFKIGFMGPISYCLLVAVTITRARTGTETYKIISKAHGGLCNFRYTDEETEA